jgi:hypothetical protein
MKSIFFKRFLFAAAVATVATGCIHDDSFDNVDTECVTLTPTKTVQEIYSQANSGTPVLYTGEDIIEAYVTSSDEGGTFYKSISFQSVDGALGFSIPVDMYNIYNEFEPGRKVYVNLNGRYINKTNDGLIIGDLFEVTSVGRLVPEEFRRTVKASCEVVNEDQIVQHMTIAQLLNNANINKLVELDNVQFEAGAVGLTYFNPDNQIGGATNVNLMDQYGNTVVFRTSEFAKFAGHIIPENSGKIRGVLTKFGSTYQFLARTEDDIMLTEDRMTIDLTPPIVGNAIVYSGSFTENFESYSTTSPQNRTFPKYINDPAIGTRYWENRTFGGNKYIQMSSFGGTPEANRTLFIVPVDMTAANGLSFDSKSGFHNGQALKVYYTTDYIVGGDITDATLVDITSNFTLSPGLSTGYPATFTNSGTWAIPAGITGNGFFVFEYVGNGNGGVTSTVQIDNIVVN